VEPTPPEDTPVEGDGRSSQALGPAASTPSPGWFAVRLMLGVLAVLALLAFLIPRGHGHGHRPIRVMGRLEWADTHEPIAGARVLSVSRYDLDTGWNPETSWAEYESIEQEREAWRADGEDDDIGLWVGIHSNAGARSTESGRVELTVGLPCTHHFGWLRGTDMTPPEDEVAALWIAPDGREPVTVLIEQAEWRELGGRGPDGLWGTYDIGTVSVPVGEPMRR